MCSRLSFTFGSVPQRWLIVITTNHPSIRFSLTNDTREGRLVLITPSLESRQLVTCTASLAHEVASYTIRPTMPAIKALVLSSLAAVAIADGLYVHSNELAAHLAKRRQMPAYGTPAYNCHDNCGKLLPCWKETRVPDLNYVD